MKKKRAVALIFGGAGREHEISVRGASYIQKKLAEIKDTDIIPVIIKRDGGWYAPKRLYADAYGMELDKCPLRPVCPVRLGERRGLLFGKKIIELAGAIPLLHGDFGEDGVIQGALEAAGIKYIGADTQTGAVLSDKAYTKLIAESLGIPVAEGIFTSRHDRMENVRHRAERLFGYPMFIKPTRLGSSVGAMAVYDSAGFASAYGRAARLGGGRVLVERLVDIEKELECGFISVSGKQIFTDIGEIACTGRFYDYKTKYCDGGGAKVSPISDASDDIKEKIRDYSARLAECVGLRHLARLDYFLSTDGKIYFNEINTFPGMTEASLYSRLAENAGYPIGELLLSFLSEAEQ